MKIKKIIFPLSILLFLSSFVNAVSISPGLVKVDFEPNLEKSFSFRTSKTSDLTVNIEGSLSKYFILEKNNIGKDGTFVITVKFPEEIETPGENKVFIGLMEKPKQGQMISTIASIRTPIIINVPYPGIYATFTVNVNDLNINETRDFSVSANNLGKEEISDSKVELKISDSKGNVVYSRLSEEKVIKVRSSQNFIFPFDASKYSPGNYKASAHITYSGEYKDLDKSFRIGSLDVSLINHTRSFMKDKISRFDITIESGWNDDIRDIYAEVRILNNTKELSFFKTASVDLEAWERKVISTFWDNSGIQEGIYDLDITLFYNGKAKTTLGKVEIISDEKGSFSINTTVILVLIVVILIMINILVLYKKKDKKRR